MNVWLNLIWFQEYPWQIEPSTKIWLSLNDCDLCRIRLTDKPVKTLWTLKKLLHIETCYIDDIRTETFTSFMPIEFLSFRNAWIWTTLYKLKQSCCYPSYCVYRLSTFIWEFAITRKFYHNSNPFHKTFKIISTELYGMQIAKMSLLVSWPFTVRFFNPITLIVSIIAHTVTKDFSLSHVIEITDFRS